MLGERISWTESRRFAYDLAERRPQDGLRQRGSFGSRSCERGELPGSDASVPRHIIYRSRIALDIDSITNMATGVLAAP